MIMMSCCGHPIGLLCLLRALLFLHNAALLTLNVHVTKWGSQSCFKPCLNGFLQCTKTVSMLTPWLICRPCDLTMTCRSTIRLHEHIYKKGSSPLKPFRTLLLLKLMPLSVKPTLPLTRPTHPNLYLPSSCASSRSHRHRGFCNLLAQPINFPTSQQVDVSSRTESTGQPFS